MRFLPFVSDKIKKAPCALYFSPQLTPPAYRPSQKAFERNFPIGVRGRVSDTPPGLRTAVTETCETAVATPLTQINVQTFFLSFEIYRRESVRHLCARPLGVISSYKAHYKGNVDEALSAHGKLRSSRLIRTLPSTPLREGQVDYACTTPKFEEEHCLGADRPSSTCSARETLSNNPSPNVRPVITVLY
ncbi:hypothetical protein AOLI_G00116580 [Acnodon oligacanthus]